MKKICALLVVLCFGFLCAENAWADSGGPICDPFNDYCGLNGPAREFSPSTNTLTVHAEDPATNPLIFDYLLGAIQNDYGGYDNKVASISYTDYYHLSIDYCNGWIGIYNDAGTEYTSRECRNKTSFDITVNYTGVDTTTKNIIKNAIKNIKKCSGLSCEYYYQMDDFRLIDLVYGYYRQQDIFSENKSYTFYRNFLPWSSDFRSDIDDQNIAILLHPLTKNNNEYRETFSGLGAVVYNNTLYDVFNGVGGEIKNVIHIPTNTTNTREAYIAAAESRLNDYFTGSYGQVYVGPGKTCSISFLEEDPQLSTKIGISTAGTDVYQLSCTVYVSTMHTFSRKIAIVKDDTRIFKPAGSTSKDALSQIQAFITPYNYSSILDNRTIRISKYNEASAAQKAASLRFTKYYAYTISLRAYDTAGGFNTTSVIHNLSVPIPESLRDKSVSIHYIAEDGLIVNTDFQKYGDYLYIENAKLGSYILGTTDPVSGDSGGGGGDIIIPDDPIPSGDTSTIHGIFTIKSAVNQKMVLDVVGGSANNGANVQLYSDNGTAAQKFIIRPVENGLYEIENLKTGKVLDVAGGSKQSGANVQQYTSNKTCAQRWYIVKNYTTKSLDSAGPITSGTTEWNGTYSIMSSCGSLFLDVAGGNARNSANIQVYKGNGTKAQQFILSEIEKIPSERVVSDGIYKIQSAKNQNVYVSVNNGAISDRSNIQLGVAGTNQEFAIKHIKDGFYRISNINSLRSLDIPGGNSFNGANVQQYSWNGSASQLWMIKDLGDGSYSLVSKLNGLYVDIASGNANDGVNIQIYKPNGSLAQKFNLIKQ